MSLSVKFSDCNCKLFRQGATSASPLGHGLERLRRDGAHLEKLPAQGVDPWPFLLAANREHIAMRLTMGGVADLLETAFGLSEFAPPSVLGTKAIANPHA